MLCNINDWSEGGGVHTLPPSSYRTFPVRSMCNTVFPVPRNRYLALDGGSLYFQFRLMGNMIGLQEGNHFRRDTACDCNRNAYGWLDKQWTLCGNATGRN